jgi:transcription elongation factor Elf1
MISFTLRKPAPCDSLPEFDCIFCEKPALRSSEAANTAAGRTFEVFCKTCGARQTITATCRADGKHWELAED